MEKVMPETWFFNRDGANIILRSRVEGDDGALGDAFSECAPGGSILNLSYEQLVASGSGKIMIVDGVAAIEPKLVPVDHDPFGDK
jgi:hypothetical protein